MLVVGMRDDVSEAKAVLKSMFMAECHACYGNVSQDLCVICPNQHVVCKDCYCLQIEARATADDRFNQAEAPTCSFCNENLPLSSHLLTPQALMAQMQLAKDLTERATVIEQQRRFEEEKRRIEQMGEQERIILREKRRIEDGLNLKCPKCCQAFVDNTGCRAVTCTCGCHFCGFCLTPQADAHACAARCSPTGSYFTDDHVFNQYHNHRRVHFVNAQLNSLPLEIRAQIRREIRTILVELGIDMNLIAN